MTLPVVLRVEASQDVEEARDYLESQRAGPGHALLVRLNEAFSRISLMAKMYGIVKWDVRAVRVRRFTYVIYYRVHEDRIEVLAVVHGSRDSSVWQSRI